MAVASNISTDQDITNLMVRSFNMGVKFAMKKYHINPGKPVQNHAPSVDAQGEDELFIRQYLSSGGNQETGEKDLNINMLYAEREIDIRTHNCLANLGVSNLNQLSDCNLNRIRNGRGVGRKTYHIIRELMIKYGINCKAVKE